MSGLRGIPRTSQSVVQLSGSFATVGVAHVTAPRPCPRYRSCTQTCERSQHPPYMPVEARDDVARIIANAAAEQHPVEVSRHLRIELVNATSQGATRRVSLSRRIN